MMVKKQELDFHQEQERLYKVNAEPWSELQQVDKEQTNQFWRQLMLGTKPEEKEVTGQELEVLQWIPLSIHMEEVTINILVIHQLLAEKNLTVKKLVLLLLEEQVLSEVQEKFIKKNCDLDN